MEILNPQVDHLVEPQVLLAIELTADGTFYSLLEKQTSRWNLENEEEKNFQEKYKVAQKAQKILIKYLQFFSTVTWLAYKHTSVNLADILSGVTSLLKNIDPLLRSKNLQREYIKFISKVMIMMNHPQTKTELFPVMAESFSHILNLLESSPRREYRFPSLLQSQCLSLLKELKTFSNYRLLCYLMSKPDLVSTLESLEGWNVDLLTYFKKLQEVDRSDFSPSKDSRSHMASKDFYETYTSSMNPLLAMEQTEKAADTLGDLELEMGEAFLERTNHNQSPPGTAPREEEEEEALSRKQLGLIASRCKAKREEDRENMEEEDIFGERPSSQRSLSLSPSPEEPFEAMEADSPSRGSQRIEICLSFDKREQWGEEDDEEELGQPHKKISM